LGFLRTEGETTIDEGRGEGLAGIGEKVDGGVKIGGGRTVHDANNGEGFAVRLKVLPRLDGEGGLLVLGVEGADGRERDRVQQ